MWTEMKTWKEMWVGWKSSLEGKLNEERLEKSGRPRQMIFILVKGKTSTVRVTAHVLTLASTYTILYLYISISVYCI